MSTETPTVQFNTQLMVEDMTLKGWHKLDLARAADMSDMTVIRFLRGERQTARTAKKLAVALNKPLSRYLIRASEAVA